MKKLIFGIILLFAIMATIPAMVSIPKADLSSVFSASKADTSANRAENKEQETEKPSEPTEADFLLLEENGEKTTYTAKEMLCGMLAAKMPENYSEESAKALAAALYSQLCYAKENRSPDKYDGADTAKKDSCGISFLTKQEAAEKYGGDFIEDCEKYADFGIKTSIKYGGKIIDAPVFVSCGGSTNSADELFTDKDLPYCKSSSSPWDMYGDIYSKKELTRGQADKAITDKLSGAQLPEEISDYVKIKSTARNGAVLEAEICGKSISGIELMNLFSLKSPCFEIEYVDDKLRFSVTGEGIPVGMSVSGAAGMAQQGAQWDDILRHYFSGCEITKN